MKSRLLLLVLSLALMSAACANKGQSFFGDTGKKVDQGIQEAGDKIDQDLNKAGEETEKTFDQAGDKVRDVTQ